MAHSLAFNSVDLSVYGLVVQSVGRPMAHGTSQIQLHNKAIAYLSAKPSIIIPVNVTVEASSIVLLQSYLDSIKLALNETDDQTLMFDVMSDRYWLARLDNMDGDRISPFTWQGLLSFLCLDPVAYSTTLTTSPYNIDADPKTINEAVGGTANIYPIYTLTAGANLVGATVKLKSVDTGLELTWAGNINLGQALIIDTELMYVTKAGVACMTEITGRFPYLLPNLTNELTVTGFGVLGTLQIRYRKRYR